MPNSALGREAARYQVARILDHLGKVPRERLSALLPLMEADGRIRLGAALETLFPGQDREDALTAFRQFRADVGRAAQDAGVVLALEADRQTRTPPDQRWCWFTGEDAAVAAVAELGERTTSGVTWSPQSALRETPTKDGKPLVRFFVSYAHADRKHKDALLELLLPMLRTARDYAFELWDDNALVLGDGWRGEIRRAIDECRFGLLLVSHEFLASRFITAEELPHFVAPDLDSPAPGRRALPVALKPVPFDDTIDLKGLREVQVFRDSDQKAFSERTGARRERFAAQLFAQIIKAVAKHPPPPPPPTGDELDSHLRDYAAGRMKGVNFVCAHATAGNLEKLQAPGRSGRQAEEPGERGDALALLEEWLNNPKGQPYAALLGELGMGKTTTAMEFTQRLLKARQTDPAVPLPLYLDLRNLGDLAKSRPSLPAMLDTLVQGIWQSGRAKVPLTADDVLRLVQTEGALVIIDGLDEVLVHLTPSEGERFTRELLRILPPRMAHAAPPAGERRGRLLVTCRTHYFRTLRDEKTMLRAEDRDAVTDTDYRILVLLPLTQDQIREYLAKTLPGEDTDRLLELIGAVHNLTEMAERPYLLSLIAKHIPEIERWKLEGRRVTGVDLYRHMVLSWLERDNPKHQITPDHKQRLMEFFAAALWRSGRRTWSVEKLEQWLIDFLADNPSLAAHYDGQNREILKEDLRTATFLVREGEDQFRFAHTSLQEYFLAAHLHRALKEGRVEAWDLAMPSVETLDFLGQFLHGDEEEVMAGLRTLRDRYRPRASELAFRYTLLAQEKGYPAPPPARFRLEGADLRDWTIAGQPDGPRLNLTAACFRGARLAGAWFHHVDLSDADFSGADLARAELIDARATSASLAGADLTGTIFRNADLTGAAFDDAMLHRTQFLLCGLTATRGLDGRETQGFFALCTPASRFATQPTDDLTLAVLTGHGGGVNSCAFSPDGGRLASAGIDGTVRLWDAAGGEAQAVLRGHDGGVRSCAFSPDGSRLASAGDDGTVRLWDAAGGVALAVLRGHDGGVMSCAFSPDGGRLASAGSDGAVRLWVSSGGEALSVLRGHGRWALSCAFSPDGGRLASAGADGTVRLWDAAGGEAQAVLRGHGGGVNSCAFSPDGGRLASASSDGTVSLWDSAGGEALAILRGHDGGVNSCAFSPDGGRLVSAGKDGTVRLWDAVGGEGMALLGEHDGWVRSCAFSPDGGRLASAGSDGMVRLWDVESREALSVLHGHGVGTSSCAFSPDGGRLASAGSDGTVRLWDAASGESLAVLRGHDDSVWSCAFSPDGECLASTGRDGTVRLWDAASGKSRAVLRGHEGSVWFGTFSPDGGRVASAGDDGTVRLWDVASGEALAVLRGHEGWVRSCAFSPDGGRVVSAGGDGTLRLWDVMGGEPLAVLTGHVGRVLSCAFSPDGGRVASAGEDGPLRLWDVASGEPVGFRIHHLPRGSWAVLDATGSRIIDTGGEAWRWLAWQGLDESGRITRYPAEIRGPLPRRGSPGPS